MIEETTPPGRGVYLTPEAVAEMVPGLTVQYLAGLRSTPLAGGPTLPYVRVNAKTIVYEKRDVLAWLDGLKRVQADRFGEKQVPALRAAS